MPDRIKKVLIVLDYDKSALKVAEVGFNMAKKMGAEVILLHVIINMVTYSLSYLKMGQLQLESIEDMNIISKYFIDKSKLNSGNSMIQSVVKQGDFAVTLLDDAKKMAVDVIIIGSHNTIWLEEIVMGRVTKEELQQTRIPILIVPTKKHDKLYTFISLEN